MVDAIANDQALIVNTYAPLYTDGQGVMVEVTKDITGRSDWLNGESYTFNLEKLDITRANGNIIDTVTIKASDNSKAHLFSLSGERYAMPGTYYYRVTEVKGTQGGVTYDTAERRFSVVVADSDLDGDLEIVSVNNDVNTTISGTWLVSANFVNVYAPAGTATAVINIEKKMDGNHDLSGYQFALYDTNPITNSEANEILKSALTAVDGKTSITLNYSALDAGKTYTYYLAEVHFGEIINNIEYSNKVYEVKVTVKDNLDGTISAETVISGLESGTIVPTFTNKYVPSSSDYVTISGKKVIVGDRVLNANEFEFVISAVTPGAPLPNVTTVKNSADGSFSFPEIEFGDAHKGNTYEYEIVEVDTNKISGFTSYDSTVYTVAVVVADNGDQTITATATVSDGTNTVDNIVFENVYDAKDAEVALEGTKLLTGKQMQDGEFEFKLEAVTTGAPMPGSAIVKNTVDGKIAFGKIVYSKAGTYSYKLYEVNGGISNYDYDNSVYSVTVTVTDNSGVLVARVELAKDGLPSTEIVFRNGFVPTPISYDIDADFGGDKTLNGRPLENAEFEFALINARNGAQIGETVKNDANGKFEFPAVSLAAPLIYHFKIV